MSETIHKEQQRAVMRLNIFLMICRLIGHVAIDLAESVSRPPNL